MGRRYRIIDVIAPNAKNILFCILLALVLWYDIFLPQSADIVTGNISGFGISPLFFFIEEIIPIGSFLGKIVGLVLYLSLCFILLRLNEIFSFIHIRTILPSFFCLLTGGLLLRPHLFSSGIIVSLLVISSVFFSFKLLMEEKPKYAFNASLLLLIAALFSFSCLWFLLVFWLFAYAGNIFSPKVFIASLLGALVSVIYAAIGFGLAGNEYLLWTYMQDSFRLFAVDFHFSLFEIIYLLFTGFLVLLSLVDFILVRSQESIKPRREFTYIITLFLTTLALIILSVPDSSLLFWLLIMFGSLLLGRYFSLKNNRFTKILLTLYFTSSFLLFLLDT